MTGQELRDAIDQFGHSVEQIARRLGVSSRSLHRYLSGRREVPKPVALAIKQQQELRRIRALIASGGDMVW